MKENNNVIDIKRVIEAKKMAANSPSKAWESSLQRDKNMSHGKVIDSKKIEHAGEEELKKQINAKRILALAFLLLSYYFFVYVLSSF